MRTFAIFLLLCSALGSWGQQDTYHRDQELRARVGTIAREEATHQKGGFCARADNNASLNGCLTREHGITEKHYTEMVLAAGAYLRLVAVDEGAPKPGRITFDDGETAWIAYREKACGAVAETWTNGTGRSPAEAQCYLHLTGTHIQELKYLVDSIVN